VRTAKRREAWNVSNEVTALPGQETLLACWAALAQKSAGARLIVSSATAAAVFPSWVPLNNAIVLNGRDGAAATAAASDLTRVYAHAGVDVWALWVPNSAADLDAPDRVREVAGLRRDTTTLVMHAALHRGLRQHDGVVCTSIRSATVAGDEPVLALDLEEPEHDPDLTGWVMVQDGVAVAGAYTFFHDTDCGIYAVGTAPGWRRRGLARSLVEHVMADAVARGTRTASLQSTRIAQPLYGSLGFEPAGRYEEWVPK
jgi:ribosomal protein S18 acetylase RimI-like enzyme